MSSLTALTQGIQIEVGDIPSACSAILWKGKALKLRLFKKRWEVYDSTGKVWESYFKESNAWMFCGEMNSWKEFFDNKTFDVRRINAEER